MEEGLPSETEIVAQAYENTPRKSKIDSEEITRRNDTAAEQREYLDNLPITNINESLNEYKDLVLKLLDPRFEENKESDDKTMTLLSKLFPHEGGYRVGKNMVDGSMKYLIVKSGNEEVSDSVLILSEPNHTEKSSEFKLEKQVYLNRETDKAFDMARVAQDAGFNTYFTILNDQQGSGGHMNLANESIQIHVDIEGRAQIPYLITHESGHTFQNQRTLGGPVMLQFADFFTAPLTLIFPKSKSHIFPGKRLKAQYREAIGLNLDERNADAFSMALMRKLRDSGLTIMSNENMLKHLKERRAERSDSKRYKPRTQ